MKKRNAKGPVRRRLLGDKQEQKTVGKENPIGREKNELKERAFVIEKELNLIKNLLNNIFEAENLPKLEKAYNDTYWRYENSYSEETNKKGWHVYVHAKKVTSVWDTGSNGVNCYVLMDKFQMTSQNEILIGLDIEDYYFHLKQKITRQQFESAVGKILAKANEAAGVGKRLR